MKSQVSDGHSESSINVTQIHYLGSRISHLASSTGSVAAGFNSGFLDLYH